MKKFFRDYFSFNQVELKGVRVLLILIAGLMLFYLVMPLFFSATPKVDVSEYRKQVNNFMASAEYDTIDYKDDSQKRHKQIYSSNFKQNWSKGDKPGFVMKPFDPNGLPLEIWIAMGLSEKQAMVIKNYENKGGKFKTKDDVKKQFVISEGFYKKIEPFIVFAEMNDEVTTAHTPLSLDINHATQEDFMLLKGVKDYLAEGIIKYRTRLGGFTSVEQMKEVKYLSEKIFNDIEPYCFITNYSVQKIQVNVAEWKEFAMHPYIGGELATKITNYRKEHGVFKNADVFKKSGLVDEPLYAKLVPYLSFSH